MKYAPPPFEPLEGGEGASKRGDYRKDCSGSGKGGIEEGKGRKEDNLELTCLNRKS